MNTQHVIARVTRRLELAEFNDAQILVLRNRVLPMFNELYKHEGYDGLKWVFKRSTDGKIKISDSENDAAWKANRAINLTRDLLEAVVGKGTPALRASKLAHALKDNPVSGVVMEKVLTLLSTRLRKLSMVKNVSPEGRTALVNFLNDPTFKLLKSSWGWIIEELRKEVPAILKRYKFLKSPAGYDYSVRKQRKTGPGDAAIVERFTEYCKSLGFTIQVAKDGEARHYEGDCPEAVKSIRGEAILGLQCIPSQGCAPFYKVGNATFNWDRLGVESGITSWSEENTIEAVIDHCIEKCEKALEERLHREKNGTKVDFGGRSLLLLPEKLAEIVALLKSGKSFTISPSGFGTAYTYTTNIQGWGKRVASEQITKLVGQPVYYSTQDLD